MSATMRTIALPTAANACTKPPKMASVVDGDLIVTKMVIATNSQIHQRHLISIMAPPSARRARFGPAMTPHYAIVHINKWQNLPGFKRLPRPVLVNVYLMAFYFLS